MHSIAKTILWAVATGDVIDSTRPNAGVVPNDTIPSALKTMARCLHADNPRGPIGTLGHVEVSAGDRLQFATSNPAQVLRAALACRCLLKSGQLKGQNNLPLHYDCRMSISIQENASDAYITSGRGLEALQATRRSKTHFGPAPNTQKPLSKKQLEAWLSSRYLLIIPPQTDSHPVDTWRLMMLSADNLVRRLTPEGAQAAYWALQGFAPGSIAHKLGIGQASTSQRMRSGFVNELLAIVDIFEHHLAQLLRAEAQADGNTLKTASTPL